MTYRERREQRAEQLRAWADNRETKAAAAFERSHELAEMIPFGQPILVGHHSERGHRAHIRRIDSTMNAAVENSGKAADMSSRADEIERQAANAIYSDDPDAIERLTAKISALETQREQRKAANAAYRKVHRAELKAMGSAYQRGQAMPFPSYSITNLTGNISRLKDRLARLEREREHGPADKIILARFDSQCADCSAELKRGQAIRYNRQQGARCMECAR